MVEHLGEGRRAAANDADIYLHDSAAVDSVLLSFETIPLSYSRCDQWIQDDPCCVGIVDRKFTAVDIEDRCDASTRHGKSTSHCGSRNQLTGDQP